MVSQVQTRNQASRTQVNTQLANSSAQGSTAGQGSIQTTSPRAGLKLPPGASASTQGPSGNTPAPSPMTNAPTPASNAPAPSAGALPHFANPAGNPGGGGGGTPGGGGGGGGGGPPGHPGNPGPAMPQPASPNPIFALSPAMVTRGVIDYTTREGVEIYKATSRSLYHDESDKFDVTSAGLIDFLRLVFSRFREAGATGTLLQIPNNSNPAHPFVQEFETSYGEITLEQCREHASTYANTQTRDAQDNAALYHALFHSLSGIGRSKVSVSEGEYKVLGVPAAVPFLRIIIREAGTDSYAMESHIRAQIANLPQYMRECNQDIPQFIIHAHELQQALSRRGARSDDFLYHVIEAFKSVDDVKLREYASRKEEEYSEGTRDFTPQLFMTLMKNKYNSLVNKGEWNKPSDEQAQILALEVKLKQLQRRKTPRSPSNKKQDDNDNTKDKSGGSKKVGKQKEKPKWMTKPPTQAEKGKPKEVDGKEYWWCEALKCWARHKPSKCRAKKSNSEGTSGTTDGKDNNRRLRFANALSTVVEESQE